LFSGDMLGICGQTGSGKSTMIKLLTWYLDPNNGKILVDGYNIGLIDVKKLRSEIFVLSQELALF